MRSLAPRSPTSQLVLLILGILLALTVGRYYYQHFILGESFQLLRFLLYFFVPLFLNLFVLKFSWKDLGVCWPQIDRRIGCTLLGLIILLPLAISLIFLSEDYLSSYGRYRLTSVDEWARMKRFLIFIISTIPFWEFMFRSVMLFGLHNLLEKRFKIQGSLTTAIPILWVMCFEVIYHYIKPDLEAFGLMIASPILSWLAFRTRSFFVPLFVHLYLESVFISFLVFF